MFGFLFKKARKQKAEELISNALISIDSLVPMPRREDFSSDPLKIKAIDDFKKEYLSMLKTNRTIVSHDLMPKELHDFKNIYLDLLVGLCIEDDTDVNFDEIYNNYSNLELDAKVKRTKLMLYHSAVKDLTLEARLRLVALNELLEYSAFNKNRSRALLNEINNMRFALFTFDSQLRAMESEMINYLNDEVYTDEQIDDDEKALLLNNHLQELKSMALLLIPEHLKHLEILELEPVLLIARLEQLLEIFVYTHSDMLDSINASVTELDKKIKEMSNEKTISFDELVEEVRRLELKYKAFSKFSRNKIYKKDLELLYSLKFWLYTHDLSNVNVYSMLENATHTEVECYQDIIFKKIESILKRKNKNVLSLAEHNGIDVETVIKYIADVLKDGKDVYSFWDILKKGILLAFLIAFDTYEGIIDFFNLLYTKDNFPDLNYYDEIFKWNSVMPLSTYYRIKKCNNITNEEKDDNNDDYDPIYEIYLLTEVYRISRIEYKMPEGLKEIIIPINIMDTKYKSVIEYIRRFVGNRRVVMPSTLERLIGNLFDETNAHKIVLNKGLQEIKNYALLVHSMKDLVILGNPTDYSSNSIPFFQLRTLTINKNADMLTDPDVIQSLYEVELLKSTDNNLYPVIYDQSREFPQSQEDYAMRSYLFKPSLMSLCILDDDGKELDIFMQSKLTFIMKVRYDFPIENIKRLADDFIIRYIKDMINDLELSGDAQKR